MSTPSYKGIVQDGLIYHTDLANAACWAVTVTTGTTYSETVTPLPTSNIAAVSDLTLEDYGLTQIDMGRVSGLTESFTLATRSGLTLTQAGYPELASAITGATDEKTGNYILFDGSYLQNFFKLEGYGYEMLPARYADGVTLETSLFITDDTLSTNDNFFLYLGTRAENKFYDEFNTLSGATTTNGLPLGPDHADDAERGVEGNAIGFLFDKQGHIGYRAIGDDMQITEEYSENRITHSGWVNISLAYTPCSKIEDPDLMECTPRRGGILRVFINGIIFHEFHGFQEYMFHGMETEKEKQIGVPYTISWGGGTSGLNISSFFGSGSTVTQVDQSGLLLRQHFNGRFNGGGQTLRIYNRPLSVFEARDNHNALATRYALPLVKGGRVTPKINW